MDTFSNKDQLLDKFHSQGHFPHEGTEGDLSTMKCLVSITTLMVLTSLSTYLTFFSSIWFKIYVLFACSYLAFATRFNIRPMPIFHRKKSYWNLIEGSGCVVLKNVLQNYIDYSLNYVISKDVIFNFALVDLSFFTIWKNNSGIMCWGTSRTWSWSEFGIVYMYIYIYIHIHTNTTFWGKVGCRSSFGEEKS